MDPWLRIAILFTHVLGIVLFVGPQFFLAFAWLPASRGIEDLPTRIAAMRTIVRRYLWIGGTGLTMATVAGLTMFLTWRNYYYMPPGTGLFAYRYGTVFLIKMGVFALMVSAVGLHTFKVGPRLVDAFEARARGEEVAEDEMRRLRYRSLSLSTAGLVLALVMMALGITLNTTTWSLG